jgi:hypothetical protein
MKNRNRLALTICVALAVAFGLGTQRSPAIREKVLGASHPDVARSLNNLADLY